MPILYGVSGSPFVRKVLVCLAEKGIAFEREDVIPINVSPEFRKISPLGKIPAFRDGEKTLSDSSVICAYLERTLPEPRLYPAADLPPLFDYLESQLGGSFLAGGAFSIGDIGIATQFVNLRLAGFGVDTKRRPKLARYVAAIHERPSFKAIIAEERATFGLV